MGEIRIESITLEGFEPHAFRVAIRLFDFTWSEVQGDKFLDVRETADSFDIDPNSGGSSKGKNGQPGRVGYAVLQAGFKGPRNNVGSPL